MEPVTAAIIAGVQLILLTLIQSWIVGNKARRDAELRSKEKEENYAREDLVAQRVIEVARLAAKSSEEMQRQLANIDEQGKKIHILVNSDMTAARTNERDQTILTLLALKRVQALGVQLGISTEPKEQEAIEQAERRIETLNQILADRLAAQKRVDSNTKSEEK